METGLQYVALVGISIVLGLEHALETDHIVAVTTLTSQTQSLGRATFLAVLWGLGHTVTLFLASLIILLLRITVPEQLGTFFEFSVGLLLIVLGVNVVRTILKGTAHSHEHEHDGVKHTHIHSHDHAADHHQHNWRSFLVGIIHGLAGSTALILLVLSSFHSLIFGLVFILCFGLGSVLGMCLITILIFVPIKLSLQSKRLNQTIQLVAGSVGVLVGLFIVLNIIRT